MSEKLKSQSIAPESTSPVFTLRSDEFAKQVNMEPDAIDGSKISFVRDIKPETKVGDVVSVLTSNGMVKAKIISINILSTNSSGFRIKLGTKQGYRPVNAKLELEII